MKNLNPIAHAVESGTDIPPKRSVAEWLIAGHPQWGLGLMLLSLHAALAWGIQEWWTRAFMLVHFGFFLLWQPVWRGERHLSPGTALLVVAGGIGLLFWGSWWLVAIWMGALIGLIGGSMLGFESRSQRLVTMLAGVYLFSMLLVWVVPHLFGDYQAPPEIILLMRYGLVVFPVLVMLAKVEKPAQRTTHVVDFIYSMMLFLLVMVLVLGSFALKMVNRGDYPLALSETLLAVAAMLLVLGWLWKPRAGFGGFGQMMSRYLLSVGLPFERWLQNLAALAEHESEPVEFLRLAVEDIATMPWVAGGEWRAPDGTGQFGSRSAHHIEFSFHYFTLDMYTNWRLSPALMLHVKLLTELLGFFYEAKRREQLQRQNAYVQAIHETGARLTHDVKNLLQSLTTLCAAAESSEPEQSMELQALFKRQLPQVTQRLQRTLEKLKAPHQSDIVEMPADVWWKNLTHRYGGEAIEFGEPAFDAEVLLPADLFDSVADNLLQNAIHKRHAQSDVQITVSLTTANRGILTVCDSGAAMPENVAQHLFDAPVPSSNGLGIGLYQAAKQAQQLGYALELAENQAGQVCFRLSENAQAHAAVNLSGQTTGGDHPVE